MAKESKPKPKQKPNLPDREQLECDALAFAELLYDIYQDKKRKESKNDSQRQGL